MSFIVNLIQHHLYTIVLFTSSGACFSLFVFFLLRTRTSRNQYFNIESFKAYVDSIITNAEAIKSRLINQGDIPQNVNLNANVQATADQSGIVNALTQDNLRLKGELEAIKQTMGKTGGAEATLLEENQKLKAEIEALKKAPPQAAASASNPAVSGADAARVKELEAKLAEYEVIVEDLANLKEYKQENERLKKELEARGNGVSGATSAGESPVPAEPVAVSVKPSEPEEVPAQVSEPVEQEKPIEVQETQPEAVSEPVAAAEEQQPAAAPVVAQEAPKEIEKIADQVEEKIQAVPPAPSPEASEKPISAAQGAEEELSDQDKALLEEFEKMIGEDKNVNP